MVPLSKRSPLIPAYPRTSPSTLSQTQTALQLFLVEPSYSALRIIINSALCRTLCGHTLPWTSTVDLLVFGTTKVDHNFASYPILIFIPCSVVRKVKFHQQLETCVRLGPTHGTLTRGFRKVSSTFASRNYI